MPKPISIQLYTLREEIKQEGFAKILKFVADTGYQAVEFAGLNGLTAQEVRKILDDLGLKACGAHHPIFDPTKTNEVVEQAQILGYKLVGGGFGQKEFENEDEIKKATDKANAAVARFTKAGLTVFYHNHWWEWDRPRKGALLFELCPGLKAQFDVYWLQTAGVDPKTVLQIYGHRTALLHVKDGPCEQKLAMTACGKGKVDLKTCLAMADQGSAEWYSVELDRCDTDMKQAVQDSYTYLVGNKLALGNK